MSGVLPWIVGYLAILLLWALIVFRRPGPTLWTGRSLAALNIAFIAVSTIVALASGESFDAGFMAFDIELIVIALALRNKWVLLGINHADSVAILERCFIQTRASCVRSESGHAVQCGGAEMTVTIRPNMVRLLNVRFAGATASKKAKLVRDLFRKQFHNSLPTPRFRA